MYARLSGPPPPRAAAAAALAAAAANAAFATAVGRSTAVLSLASELGAWDIA